MAAKKKKGADDDKAKSGFAPKDWVTLAISLVALSVSAGSAYLNIQRIEHLGVVARYTLQIDKDGDKLSAKPDDEHVLTFINAGSRPVTIFGLQIIFVQHAEQTDSGCFPRTKAATDGRFDTDLQPFVVKENEVVIKKIKLGPRHPFGELRVEGPDANSVPVIDELKGKARIPIEVCLTAEVSTPTVAVHTETVSIWRYVVEDWGAFYDDTSNLSNKPGVLVDRRVTIFGW